MPILAESLIIEGWLYLMRPALALGVVVFALLMWAMDRREGRERRLAALAPAALGDWVVSVVGSPAGRHRIEGALTIGRSPDCAVLLTDPASSAVHAVVTLGVDGIPVLEDLGSTNGTLLRGQLVTAPTPLVAGDVIQIGDVVLQIGRA